jgi:hypothetical protein
VKTIALEMSYPSVNDSSLARLREIFETNPGEVPVMVRLTEVPLELARAAGSDGAQVQLKLNHHFRIQPGQKFTSAITELKAQLQYLF